MSYNAEQDLEYIESVLALQLNIIGLEAEDMDILSIDEIITKARTFNLVNQDIEPSAILLNNAEAEFYKDEPAIAILRSQRNITISTIRRFWWMRQLALGAV
jgi:hypothetical protein